MTVGKGAVAVAASDMNGLRGHGGLVNTVNEVKYPANCTTREFQDHAISLASGLNYFQNKSETRWTTLHFGFDEVIRQKYNF